MSASYLLKGRNGSAAPVRGLQMQSFRRVLVPGPCTRSSEATGSNRCIAEVDDAALNAGKRREQSVG